MVAAVTEQAWAELGTALHAHKLEMLRIAGLLAKRAAEQTEARAGATVDRWAHETLLDSMSLAAGVEDLVRRADSLLEDTAVMSLDCIADE